ncbi:hypothetical protein Hanom_Chr00s001245g01677821 [Helianthus anomalus]
MHYFIHDFSHISKDLFLIPYDVIIFEKVGHYDFRIQLFRPHGFQSLTPELPFMEAVTFPEAEHERVFMK